VDDSQILSGLVYVFDVVNLKQHGDGSKAMNDNADYTMTPYAGTDK